MFSILGITHNFERLPRWRNISGWRQPILLLDRSLEEKKTKNKISKQSVNVCLFTLRPIFLHYRGFEYCKCGTGFHIQFGISCSSGVSKLWPAGQLWPDNWFWVARSVSKKHAHCGRHTVFNQTNCLCNCSVYLAMAALQCSERVGTGAWVQKNIIYFGSQPQSLTSLLLLYRNKTYYVCAVRTLGGQTLVWPIWQPWLPVSPTITSLSHPDNILVHMPSSHSWYCCQNNSMYPKKYFSSGP